MTLDHVGNFKDEDYEVSERLSDKTNALNNTAITDLNACPKVIWRWTGAKESFGEATILGQKSIYIAWSKAVSLKIEKMAKM